MRKHLIALLLFWPLWVGAAAEYWVDLSGAGTNDADGRDVNNLCAGDDDADCAPSAGDTVRLCNAATSTVGINTVGSSGSLIAYTNACPGGTDGSIETSGTDLALSIGSSANYLSFTGIPITQTGTASCVFVNGSDNITFDGLDIRGCGAHAFAFSATAVSSGIVFDGLLFSEVDQSCISLIDTTAAGAFSDWSITNSDFSGCNTDGNTAYPSIRLTIDSSDTTSTFPDFTLTGNTFANNLGSQGVRIGYNDTSACSGGVCPTRQNAVIDPVVTGNTITSGWGFLGLRHALRGRLAENDISGTSGNQGGFVLFHSDGTIVEQNDCENMTTNDIDGGCVDLDHGNVNGIVRRNWCKDIAGKDGVSNSGYCVMVLDSEGNAVYSNISVNSKYCLFIGNNFGLSGNPNVIAQNGCYGSDVADLYVRSTVTEDVVDADNNLFLSSDGYAVLNESGVDQSLDYSAIYGAASGAYSGQTAGANDLNSDPGLVGDPNPTTPEGFKLSPSSPLIGAGTCYLTTGCVHYDYEGKRARVPPDIGAFQRN